MVERVVRGRSITIGSISAEPGGNKQAHYCAKTGVNLPVKSMAVSLGPFGITCNAVLPGTDETDSNLTAWSIRGSVFTGQTWHH
jgi:L-rhamnose 1-dehydrogenase